MTNQEKIVVLISEINLLSNERYELEQTCNGRIEEVFNSHFNPFSEFQITVRGGSATFYSIDDKGENKEIFSLNFYDAYKQKPVLKPSYYSTSSYSNFELERLVILGKVAKILLNKSEFIVDEIEGIKNPFNEISKNIYGKQHDKEVEIRNLKEEIKYEKILVLKSAILSEEGIKFSSWKRLYLKVNLNPNMDWIKVTETKGKTVTVHYSLQGNVSSESRVNLDNILSEIYAYGEL
jgi:hypothetical protein